MYNRYFLLRSERLARACRLLDTETIVRDQSVKAHVDPRLVGASRELRSILERLYFLFVHELFVGPSIFYLLKLLFVRQVSDLEEVVT